MPTVDETGRWVWPPPGMLPAVNAEPRYAAAHARVERLRAECSKLARDAAMTARLARAAIDAPDAQALFERAHAQHELSAGARAALRRAELAYERERRAARLTRQAGEP